MFSGIISFIMGIWNLLMIIPIVISIASLIISLTPTPQDDKVWAKVYKWITKDEFIQIKSEYYDEDDDLVKSDFGYDFKKMDGRLIPSRIEIVPADGEGKKTVILLKEVQFDVELPTTYFSQAVL